LCVVRCALCVVRCALCVVRARLPGFQPGNRARTGKTRQPSFPLPAPVLSCSASSWQSTSKTCARNTQIP
jgi:hypothetical protein